MGLLGDIKTSVQILESIIYMDICSSRASKFNVKGSQPPSTVLTMFHMSSSTLTQSNTENTNLQGQIPYGMLMGITSSAHEGIVIYGFTDGYDRVVHPLRNNNQPIAEQSMDTWQITGMRVSSSNTTKTVLKLFLESIEKFGCPYWVRGDRGSENVDLCTWMIIYQGPSHASFMWGT